MRWEDGRESSNVDDDRGAGDGGGGGGFGGGGLGGLGGLLGLLPLLGGGGGGILVLVVIGLMLFGGPLLRGMGGGSSAPQRAPSGYQGPAAGQQAASPGGDPSLRFVKVIAGYTEDTWSRVFQDIGRTYTPPRFTIYTGGHKTACGYGQTEMGPFYCPGDQRVYLDLAFFQELSGRFGAPGDFAKAYVVAHEVGHHVQNLLGTSSRVGQESGPTSGSVRTELQADCYAGVWAVQTNRLHGDRVMEPGDLEAGLKAASSVGDDTLQRASRGRVSPDSFTHGAASQRTRWLRTGYETGDIKACDTFSPSYDQL